MAEGWISVHRSIFDCWVWKEKPFSMGQAWLDLLLLANHKSEKRLYNGELKTFEPGTVNRSVVSLSIRWGWNRKTTTKFLKLLENDEMIAIKSTTKGTTITIVNYGKFQGSGTTKGTAKGTTEGQLRDSDMDINNNDNNVNNVNNKKSRAFAPPSLEEVREYCQKRNNQVDPEAFISFYESKGWMIGKNKMKDWQAAIRTWERSRSERASPKNKVHNYEHERNYSDSFLDQLGQRLAKN